MIDFLSYTIEYAKGVGPVRGELLKKEIQVNTFGDLLWYFPYRYIDRSQFHAVASIAEEGVYVQLRGRIIGVRVQGEKRRARLTAVLQDSTGAIEMIWFQGVKWISEKLISGQEYVVFGRVSAFNKRYNMAHPEFELFSDYLKSTPEKFQPQYNSGEKLKAKGFDSRGIMKVIRHILSHPSFYVPETLPPWLLKHEDLMPLSEAIRNIHFPASAEKMAKARYRLKYEELLVIQLHLLYLKHDRYRKAQGHVFATVGKCFHFFYKHKLPFELTGAQKRVIKELRADMGSGRQLNRLLQGDVGSGKTLVALMAVLIAIDNGYQAALMAPTEILAQQHMHTISKFLEGMDLRVALLTGSSKVPYRRKLLADLAHGEINLLIGTHALIESPVVFKSLGLAIIDEQHRFGVEQRASLRDKNVIPPHILVMTATPIPRTLAMTLYGDLDYSVIDELPPGRKPVKTVHYNDSKRLKVFEFVRQQVAMGRQIYFVYPLIDESEKLDLKDLTDGFESISRSFPLPQYAVSMVHGRMKPDIKEFEMARFVKGETNIMVSTTVIEVGVDVPNATVMVIESAARFGLSQLHQLRGRVGRGADQSWCILMTDEKITAVARTRIRTMVASNDGFEIADVDLSLRGPGDFQGTRQSGLPDLKIADLVKDDKILKRARETAQMIIDKDPNLQHPANGSLKKLLAGKFGDTPGYSIVG